MKKLSTKTKSKPVKTVTKNKYNQKSKYFIFDANDINKWQGIYRFIIK